MKQPRLDLPNAKVYLSTNKKQLQFQIPEPNQGACSTPRT